MQAEFQDGTLAKKCMWQTVILVLKGKEGFRGIGLVEVLWKAIPIPLNRWLTESISFHDTLHGFSLGQETGTAAFEANLLQHIISMREAVLFEVFLDLRKAYNDLDQDRALDLPAAYRIGPSTVRLLWTYRDRLTTISKAVGYFGRPFKGYQGVTQEDPLSPTILNVVIQHWVTVVMPNEAGTGGLGLTIIDLAAYFYDDDGIRGVNLTGEAT